MRICAVLTVEAAGGRRIPLARSRDPEVLRAVADSALRDVVHAQSAEEDEVLAAIIGQEADRLRKALALFGLTSVVRED